MIKLKSGKLMDLAFRHLVQFPTFDCVFCSTEEKETGRTRLYLIFNHKSKIYLRNGIRGTWDEVKEEDEVNFIRDGYTSAIRERNVPCYTTS